jgi:hypothetical protein
MMMNKFSAKRELIFSMIEGVDKKHFVSFPRYYSFKMLTSTALRVHYTSYHIIIDFGVDSSRLPNELRRSLT